MDVKVEITWLDACSEDHILSLEAIKNIKPLVRHNVGYLIEETDSQVLISQGIIENMYHEETGYDGCQCIPKLMILSVTRL